MRYYIVTDRSQRVRQGAWLLREMTITHANLQNHRLVQGPVEFVDTRNNKRTGRVFIRPTNTITAGVPFGRPYHSPFSVR